MSEQTLFRYYGGGTERDLIARSGQAVTVLSELGDDQRDPEVGRMFRVRFADGFKADAFEDELPDLEAVMPAA